MADKKNTIGRFEIIEKIGEGPIGAVYKASDPVIRRIVAIKVVKLYALEETTSFAEVFEKIYRVVRSSTSLNHPNICIIYDLSEEKKIPFITMEYVEGQDLDALLQKKHQFKRVQLMNVLSQVCDALDFAHRKNVVHQDLKTTNILITPDIIVKITDFGIAGLDEIAAAQTKKLLSIPFYISPEQAVGAKVTAASDLFSLGVIAYQLLSGELPFRGTSTPNVVMTIAQEPPAVPKDLEKSGINRSDWDQFFATALAKSPEKRFQTANDLFEALNNIVPPSDHSYFPYAFSGSENDRTGEFEKTFISETSSPTVLIDAKKLFQEVEAEQQKASEEVKPQLPEIVTEPAEEIPAHAEEIHASEPELQPLEVPQAQAQQAEAPQSPVAAEVAADMPEEEEAAQTMSPVSAQMNPPDLNDRTADQKKEEPAPATQLIEIPSFSEEAIAKSNGSGNTAPPTQLLQRPVEATSEPVSEPTRPKISETRAPVLTQGTGAVVDSQVRPTIEQVPTQAPRMIRPQPTQAPPAPQYIPPQKKAGPPNLKRYLVAALIIAVFILGVGGYILFRNPSAENVAQNKVQQPVNNIGNAGAKSTASIPPAGNVNPSTPVAPVTGILTINSNPAGAKVSINGEQKGITPLQLDQIDAGHYQILLQLNGYKDQQQSVDLTEQNKMPEVQATLEKASPVSGTLVIESTPTDAFIVISNRVIGVTPKTIPNFKAGKYSITVKKDGYEDYTGSVRVNQDKTAVLRAQLVEIPKPPPVVVETKKPEPTVHSGDLVTLGPGVTPPRNIKRTFAKYPPSARDRKIEGTVNMSVLVSEKGQVLDVKVLQSSHRLLEDAAVNAVKTWEYQPATKEGVPVKVWVPVSMNFQLGH